jgi:ABC-2 type transport system ATP-binding protein
MSEAPAIVAEDLVKVYSGRGRKPAVHALDGLSLTVPEGRVFGLLGPNGAGKSTTTKILTTLSRPTSGTARVDGHDVLRAPDAVRAAIGYVSQGSSTDPVLTATENLEIAARLRGVGPADARKGAARLLDEFGLAEASRRPVSTFSGGMRRRLDVAAALVHRPRVLFLDEPTTGLDPEARAAMWAEIRRLSGEESLTVVLTTHYMEEADRLADELLLVNGGRVVVQGTPEELKAALHGDSLRVSLIEPDSAAVRAAVARVTGLRDIVVEASGVDGVLAARTDDASAAVGAVIAALDAAGIRFGQVAASHPTLDDVYLHFVGHTFAEAGAAGAPTIETGAAA